MSRIYVASSWRNSHFPEVVRRLKEAGHEVYDFRNPPDGGHGFKWSELSEDYMEWTPQQYRENLTHPKAEKQFDNDVRAMESCDICVLLLPCGRSAHTEAGWFAGRGKKVFVLIPEKQEPELMYKLFDGVFCSIEELLKELKKKKPIEKQHLKIYTLEEYSRLIRLKREKEKKGIKPME